MGKQNYNISFNNFIFAFTKQLVYTIDCFFYSYIGDMMAEEAPEALENFGLEPFEMKVQGLDRTLADKVFAICDYYMQERVKKHSRHIYDTYKVSA